MFEKGTRPVAAIKWVLWLFAMLSATVLAVAVGSHLGTTYLSAHRNVDDVRSAASDIVNDADAVFAPID